jgi:hypothetical protein
MSWFFQRIIIIIFFFFCNFVIDFIYFQTWLEKKGSPLILFIFQIWFFDDNLHSVFLVWGSVFDIYVRFLLHFATHRYEKKNLKIFNFMHGVKTKDAILYFIRLKCVNSITS